jgi:hypothetical protein
MRLRGGGNLAIIPLISFDWFAARLSSWIDIVKEVV